MKFTRYALALCVSAPLSGAFAPSSRSSLRYGTTSMKSSSSTDVDISIPYDAAARLAYDEWLEKYEKGAFDPKRYESFKKNYETITVANVAAKKKARDTNAEIGQLLTLNEYGDCSEEEYKQMSSGGSSVGTGDVLGKAVAAAKSQADASSALEDAANALAKEEEVRNK